MDRPFSSIALPANALLAALIVLQFVFARTAIAYRPFDSTDADVAHAEEFELELGPAGRLREGSKKFLVAPALVANIGLVGDRELVVEGRREAALDREPPEPRSALVDNGVFIKQVLRRGVLQDERGPSVATEYGLLLASVHGERGTGASAAGIVSQRWEIATVHLNAALAWTRQHEPDLFVGAILEGPYYWRVRPVAEAFTEHAAGSARVKSQLVGAIWRIRDDLSVDVGLRTARAGAEPVREFRLGLTWTFSFKKQQ